MVTFTPHKVIANLPSVLVPDALYAVRVGAGFDLYVADATGAVAHKLNSPHSFLPRPDRTDYTGERYWYYGWGDVNGGWRIHRRDLRNAGALQSTTTGAADFDTAWANRATLGYS